MKRYVRFMAKKELFDNKIAGPLLRGMHHISVDRSNGSASFVQALRALRDGEIDLLLGAEDDDTLFGETSDDVLEGGE